ncbi:MAG: isochorismate synthase [Corynebacteriales bacterium]|nr:isochorismate synthase [Mycobacteriales bacterium]
MRTSAVRSWTLDPAADLLDYVPPSAPLAWIRNGEGVIGLGEAARFTIPAGPDRFARAEEVFAEFANQVGSSDIVAFGSFTFDPRTAGSTLIVPQLSITRRDGQMWATSIGEPPPIEKYRAQGLPTPINFTSGSSTPEQWTDSVAHAVRAIHTTELEKVVLARDVVARAEQPIVTSEVLRRLTDRFPDCFTFACDGLIGATPELLAARHGIRVESLLLAGSSRRSADPTIDEALGTALLESTKDAIEHKLSVESLHQTLAPLCKELELDAEPWLLRLANVQHLATRAVGTLADESTSALAIAGALHPTAAVCGTPTMAALDLIRESEGMDRGRYCGPVGWMNAEGNGEWGIALRCAHIDNDRARLFAGCGIVADSDPAAELAETEVKFDAMRAALSGEH